MDARLCSRPPFTTFCLPDEHSNEVSSRQCAKKSSNQVLQDCVRFIVQCFGEQFGLSSGLMLSTSGMTPFQLRLVFLKRISRMPLDLTGRDFMHYVRIIRLGIEVSRSISGGAPSVRRLHLL